MMASSTTSIASVAPPCEVKSRVSTFTERRVEMLPARPMAAAVPPTVTTSSDLRLSVPK